MVAIAVIHFTNYPKGQSRGSMHAVMRYAAQEKKTRLPDGQSLVSGVNCRPESAYSDFLNTKLLHHKEGGVLFFHMVQSFPKGEEVDPKTAHAAALRLAEYFGDREVLVCTHNDREHIHSHFIINSVSFNNGKKLHISQPELVELRQQNDAICQEFGLPVFQKQPNRKKVKSMSGAEYHAAAKGESWKMRLMNVIDQSMQYAASREEFVAIMKAEGYQVKWTDSRKNITYTTPEGQPCRDNKLHEDKYFKEAMEHEFTIRQALIAGRIEKAESPARCDPTVAVAGESSDAGGMVGYDGGAGYAEAADRHTKRPAGQEAPPADRLRHQGASGEDHEGIVLDPQPAGTGWEAEREAFFASLALAAPPMELAAGDPHNGCDLGGLVGDMVKLGYHLEQFAEPAPVVDATTRPHHMDKKDREKRIALGQRADDEPSYSQTMSW